jgi:predicted RNase H-like HicB family nuclease
MRYAIVIEHAGANFSGYVPDVPGCIATGATPDETRTNLVAALEMHLEGLREDGLDIPESSTLCEYVAIPDVPRAAE